MIYRNVLSRHSFLGPFFSLFSNMPKDSLKEVWILFVLQKVLTIVSLQTQSLRDPSPPLPSPVTPLFVGLGREAPKLLLKKKCIGQFIVRVLSYFILANFNRRPLVEPKVIRSCNKVHTY